MVTAAVFSILNQFQYLDYPNIRQITWTAWQPLLLNKLPAFRHCRSHFSGTFLLSFLRIIAINAFPLRNFVLALVKNENVHNGSLIKQNNYLKNSNPSVDAQQESFCGLLITPRAGKLETDTYDSKDEKMPTIQRQSLRPLKAIGQSISIEKSEWKSRIEKKQDIRTFEGNRLIQ